MESLKLPAALREHKHKLFGLTIDPDRLTAIRNERKPNSRYSSFAQCEFEVREVENLFLGGDATQYYYSMKVVGVLPKDNRAVTIMFPKVKITKGFNVSFNNDNFGNLPIEITPYPLVSDDALYSFYPGRRMLIFPA